jgi:hypothetical protein
MTEEIRTAMRKLDECCRQRTQCIYGAGTYNFHSYDIRGARVFIDLRAANKEIISADVAAESLPAFMERALQKTKSSIPTSLADLVFNKSKKAVKKTGMDEPVIVWILKGKPLYFMFSYWLTDELERINPSRAVSVSFNAKSKNDDRIYILLSEASSTKMITAKRGRLSLRCSSFAEKIKHTKYQWSFADIEQCKVLILTPDKDSKYEG